MKIIMSANANVGFTGIGSRTHKILGESQKRGYLVDIFCRSYKRGDYSSDIKFIKPIPFARWIYYGIIGMRYFVSLKFSLFRKLQLFFDKSFDKIISKKLKNAVIFHTWDTSLFQLKKAKELGMITVKDCVIQNDEGIAKLYPDDPHYKGLKMAEDLRKSLAHIDYFLVPCDFVGMSYEAVGVPKERIVKIPFGADVKTFYPDRSEKDNRFRILFAGLIMKRKGVDTLLEAVYQLESEGKLKNYEVVLAGRVVIDIRDKINKYKKKLKCLKLSGHLPHDKMNSFFNSGDIFVFPSLAESSAKVNYEALASGLPIITTFNTGTVVRDGEEGFIIPTHNIGKLKEKIMFFYENREKLREMGINARKRAEEFTWDIYANRVNDFYEKIVKN